MYGSILLFTEIIIRLHFARAQILETPLELYIVHIPLRLINLNETNIYHVNEIVYPFTYPFTWEKARNNLISFKNQDSLHIHYTPILGI
jgi:hypothetical protein